MLVLFIKINLKKNNNNVTTPHYSISTFNTCQVVSYERLKTKENVKLFTLKVIVVAYERWSLTRGSKYSDIT